LDLKIKMRSNHKIGTTNEFFSPINPKKHVLCNKIGQTIKKIIKQLYISKWRWRPFWILGCKKVSQHFLEGHGGSNPHLAFLDHKSTEKPTYALNCHGSIINDPNKCLNLAAILDLKVRMRSNHKSGTTNEFFNPINPNKHVLYNKIGQTIKKIIKNIYFKMAMAAILDFGL